MNKEEDNSLKKTLYLLSTPANTRRLARSIADARAGKPKEINLDNIQD